MAPPARSASMDRQPKNDYINSKAMDPALAKEIAILAQHHNLCEAAKTGESEIQKFYDGATLFVTGSSGFIGKQMLEKLFRTCDIKKVFVLLRPKSKRIFCERLELMLSDPVFDAVKKIKPDFGKDIHSVQGDICEPRLGISDADWEAITAEVDIIIHGAATVNFDAPIKMAALTNVRGTVETLKLGKACKKLRSYVHISTAFSFATKSRINKDVLEQFYEPPMKANILIEMVEKADSDRLDGISNHLKDWPNNYTFTKAIAEDAVREMSSELPVSIVRPAIVIASNREPSPGWLEPSCAFGPTGLVLGIGLGILHTSLADMNIKLDLVPVDLVNNAVIAAGWATAKRRLEGEKEAQIYTVTSMRNPILYGEVTEILNTEVGKHYASPKLVWYRFVTKTANLWIYWFLSMLWHFIPAYVVDFVLYLTGKRPMMVKLYTKVDKLIKVLGYFTCNEWKSSDRNLVTLHNSLSHSDQVIYNFDVKTIDWHEQMLLWGLGCRKYIIKDGLQGTEQGMRKQFWFRIAHYIISALYFYCLYKLFALALGVGVQGIYYVNELAKYVR